MFLIVIIVILIVVVIIYKLLRYYRLKHIRDTIFKVHMNDIKLKDNIRDEPNYNKVLEVIDSRTNYVEITYILRYLKFVQRDDVYSMCSDDEVDQITHIIEDINNKDVKGVIVEAGVWRGGMSAYIRALLNYYNDDRHLYLFDTFGGFPESQLNNKDQRIHPIMQLIYRDYQLNQVKQLFKRFDLLANTNFIQGKFVNTIPKTSIKKIAILRLDADYYEPTLYVLEQCYYKISPGGYVIVDDYNNPYVGCKQAVLEFRAKYNITTPIVDDYGGSIYWIV